MKKKRKRYLRNILLSLVAVFILALAGSYLLAQIYKKQILDEINSTINEKINGELNVKDVNFTFFSHFPSLSLTLIGATIHDSLYPVHHQELFRADKVYLQIAVLKLLTGEVNLKMITVQNANVSLLVLKNGYQNYDILKKDTVKAHPPSSSSMITTVNKIILNNVKFSLVDSVKDKWFKFQLNHIQSEVKSSSSTLGISINGGIHFDGLAFNPSKGSYLTNKTFTVKLRLGFDPQGKVVEIYSSDVRVDGNLLSVKGNFSFMARPHMHLEIFAPNITVKEANTILTRNISEKLSRFSFDNPVMAAVYIDGMLSSGSTPSVDVFFKSTDNRLEMQTKAFSDVNMLGWFMNHADSTQITGDDNSRVAISRFNASMDGIPITSKLMITNLNDPFLDMDAKINMSLEDANGIVDSSVLYFSAGKLALAFLYHGKFIDYADTVNHRFLGNVKGSIKVNDGELYYLPRNFHFGKINTDMVFDSAQLSINNVSVEINNNPVHIAGSIRQFINFLFFPGDALEAALSVNAPVLNFDNFKSSPEKSALRKKKADAKSDAKKVSEHLKIRQIINTIIDKTEADILLSATEVNYRHFKATDLSGEVDISSNHVKFKNLQMKTSGGSFAVNGGVQNLLQPPARMSISASIINSTISDLFYSFDNFQQKTITDKNIRGTLSTTATFNASLKKDYSIIPESMTGKIVLVIKNGALINFKALNDVSKYVFKNRDFDHIEFAQLKDTITLMGQIMHFSRMEIESSVLTFFTEGKYGFKGGTDLSIQIPLSNLKKREGDFKPTNVGTDAKLGPSIFLRAVDDANGNLQIKYDPFKSFFKEKDSIKRQKEKGKRLLNQAEDAEKKKQQSASDSLQTLHK